MIQKTRIAALGLAVIVMAALLAVAPASPAGATSASWWNSSYDHRLSVHVQSVSALPSGYATQVTINHAALVAAGRSLASGNDVRVVYWNGTTNTELDRLLEPNTAGASSAWNTSATKFWFKTQAAISAGTMDNGTYWIYYGNSSATSPPANGNNIFDLYDDFSGGSIDSTKWNVGTNSGVTVTQTGGELVVAGTSASSGVMSGIKSKTILGTGMQYDSSFKITSQSANAQANYKADVGSDFGTGVGIKSTGSSTKRIKSYSSGFIDLGPTTLQSQTFGYQRISETLSTGGTMRHTENGVFQASRTGASADINYYTYGPDAFPETFSVAFDDIAIHKFVDFAPVLTLDVAADTTVSATIDPSFSFGVANQSSTCNGESNFLSSAGSATAVSLGHISTSQNLSGGQALSVGSNTGGGFSVYIRGTSASQNLTSTAHNWTDASGVYPTGAALGSGEAFGYTFKDSTASSSVINPANAFFIALDATNRAIMGSTSSVSGNGCVTFDAQTSATTQAGSYSASVIYVAVPVY